MELPINQIICGDCEKILSNFPPNTVDLTVTSPPYGNLREYKGYSFNFEKIAQQLFRITKDGGVVVWIVGDQTINGSESGESFRQSLYFKSVGFNLHDTMIYEKGGLGYPTTNRYYPIFEYMFVFSKHPPKTFNPLKDRKNRWLGMSWSKRRSDRQKDGSLKHKDRKENYREYGIRFNIWRYLIGGRGWGQPHTPQLAAQHPATFPLELAADHIKSWSNKNDLILDPMCGSGTTLVAAYLLGRNYVGIDISPEYCEITRKRVQIEKEKPSLKIF